MEKKNAPVTIYTESSPNPNSLKFVCEFALIENHVDFPDLESAEFSPLAKSIFENFDFCKRVFIAANFVTVTKDNESDWFEVAPKVKKLIKNHLEEGKAILSDDFKQQVKEAQEQIKNNTTTEETEIVKKIKVVLDDYVKPAVESDGGAISFHSFEEGVVKVLLQGSCSGCPSSTMTLKNGIENLLQRMVPEVKEVVAEGV